MRSALFFLAALGAHGAEAQPTTLLWGDTHLHTSSSVDAFSMGNYFADPWPFERFELCGIATNSAPVARVR